MATDLLPPNATRFERAMASSAARISDVPIDLASLWDPATCPMSLLPWLAWAVSIDDWRPEWSDDQRRHAVATAIDEQRHKGTRATVEAVLDRFDSLLELVEWFDATPQAEPYTFEVRLPVVTHEGATGGERVSANTARAIVAEVARAKPARAHFTLVHTLSLAADAAPVAAAYSAGFVRLTGPASEGSDLPWSDFLQAETGEPLTDDLNQFIDGTAP